MAAAALRPMMAAAKEEATILATEASASVRTSVVAEATAAARAGGKEAFNPLAVREAAEASAKQALNTGEGSLFSSITRAGAETPTTLSSSTSTVSNTILSEIGAETAHSTMTTAKTETTVVGQALEQDIGVTIKEAMTNAGETGLQEIAEQVSEAAKKVIDGGMLKPGADASALRPQM